MKVTSIALLLVFFASVFPALAEDEQAGFSVRFAHHEPVYFSAGWRVRTNARLQLSFKYRFFQPNSDSPRVKGLFENLYFAYTQTSLWDLDSESHPFHDTAYKPSMFYYRNVKQAADGKPAFSHMMGLGHESNGRAEEFSRSINFLFYQPSWTWVLAQHNWASRGVLKGYRFTLAPKFHYYVGDLSDNPDIEDYRGYVDLHMAVTRDESWKFAAMLRKGTAKSYGSVLLDVSYPIYRVFGGVFHAYLHLQYFNGWGESILDYNIKYPAQYRVGLMLIR